MYYINTTINNQLLPNGHGVFHFLTNNLVSKELSLIQWFDNMAQMLIIQRTEFPYP